MIFNFIDRLAMVYSSVYSEMTNNILLGPCLDLVNISQPSKSRLEKKKLWKVKVKNWQPLIFLVDDKQRKFWYIYYKYLKQKWL